MRLLRMKLKDWRGIGERDVAFKDGVTILEGPNEIGKSSIVEALFTLINDFSSSTKAAVKHVQPVGRDVGSMVEAEISVGKYQFIYKKTFNKEKTTELNILAPANSQLTGREAHEYVNELLKETVDLDLWKALLVDQGGQIAPVGLKDSQSLSNALDAAAAGSVSTGEDVALLQAVQTEYENFFTLKAGKDKLADLDKALVQAEATLVQVTADLREVEQDAERHQGFESDIRRRLAELPVLQKNLEKHRRNKETTDKLESELQLALTKLSAAEDRQRGANVASSDRNALIEAIASGEKSLTEENETLEPFQKRVMALAKELETAQHAVENSASARRQNAQALEIARSDQTHVENNLALGQLEQLTSNVEKTEEKLKSALDQVALISIDESGLESLRNVESNLRVMKGQRDHAATHLTLTADKDLMLQVDGVSIDIAQGETQEQAVSNEIEMNIQGVAAIRVSPPKSASELDQKLQQEQQSFDRSLSKCGVDNLEEATIALARKQGFQQEAEQLKSRLSDLLGSNSVQDVRHDVLRMRRACESYVEARDAESSLPQDIEEARQTFNLARQALNTAESGFEKAQKRERELRGEHEQADTLLRDAQNNRSSLQATLDERRRRLENARAEVSDADLATQLEHARVSAAEVSANLSRLKSELSSLSPDTVEGLFENAQAALARAKTDLAGAEQEHAVFKDRLDRAKANGRFEARESSERKRDQLKDELETKRKRAGAARRLWETLNRHRDDARQAYVRPLKIAIEDLGRIVFGSSFQVVVDDDWTLATRTLNGVTLPFDSLSVGTQEQLSILTRLAAAQIVSKHGGVPLIIDDALGFSDPARLESMGAAIAAAGKSCQIIILTCAPGRFTHVGNAEVVRF